jgi:hypothetical protein
MAGVSSAAGTAPGSMHPGGAEMFRRLWFGIALIAVLFCFWLVLTRPICGDGFEPTIGTRSGWTCVANDNPGRK